MKKTLCVLLSLLLLLGMTSLAQADEAMTLRLWVRYDDDFSACIADFEALHPGVKIIQEQVGNNYDDLLAKYNTGMQSNDMPNIGVTGQRNGIPQLYDAGWLLPIENYLTAEEMDDVVENFWTRYTYDGKRMSMPFSCTIPGCYVNLTMLHELGYENMPETLDELCAEGALELCERLSVEEYDEERGKLTTYLHPFLRGKMYRYLEANLGAAALPKDEMQRVKQAQRLHKEENLSPDEVAQMLGVSAEKAAQLIGSKTKSLSVSALSNDDPDDDPLAWLLLDQHALTPEQAVYRQVCTEDLEQLFRTLSAKDRAILGHTYGVFGYSCISLNLFWKPDSISFTRSFAGCTSVMSANLRRRFHRLFRFF